MKTYKTLVRKSDGQWMEVYNNEMFETDKPRMLDVSATIEDYKQAMFTPASNIYQSPKGFTAKEKYELICWSLYELIEVAIVRMDDVPSEEDVSKEITARFGGDYGQEQASKLIEKYKRQIFGELIGHKSKIFK